MAEQERAEQGRDQTVEPVGLTLTQVAARAGVTAATVRRWVRMGLIPGYDGRWTPAAAAYVRVVARLRARGHTLAEIKRASERGQLAVAPIEVILSGSEGRYTLKQVARASGLQPELIERILGALGLSALATEPMSEEDRETWAATLDSGSWERLSRRGSEWPVRPTINPARPPS